MKCRNDKTVITVNVNGTHIELQNKTLNAKIRDF